MMPNLTAWYLDAGDPATASDATLPGWPDPFTPQLAEVLQVLNDVLDGGLVAEETETACPAA